MSDKYKLNDYEIKCYLYSIYPMLINFTKFINKFNNEYFIAFLARDPYFVYLLYKQLYPNLKENNDYAFIPSSRHCFLTQNKNYYRYLENLRKKKGKLLLVDIQGTGKTFYIFKVFF